MRTARLGCFTSVGIIAGLITAFAIAGYALASGGQMFSPGDLNTVAGHLLGNVTSHADIGGECGACHVAPWGSETMQDRCVVCHEDVPVQMLDLLTPHGRMFAIDSEARCRDCHPEHRGATALLTDIDGWRYPHQLSGYYLTVHQFKAENGAFQCLDCHGDDVTTFDVNICESCHNDLDQIFTMSHVLSYGSSCLNCHDGMDSMTTDFTHENFQFNLTGKHLDVACQDCHNGARDLGGFEMTPQDCGSCHGNDDPHEGVLGSDCASCHSPEGWAPSQFDHNRSAFKLGDAHVSLTCVKCHSDKLFKGTPQDCFSCHQQDDLHMGALGTDCASCHTATTWKDVIFKHSMSAFALVGRHVDVACSECHKDLAFRGTPSACASCHMDVHKGEMGMDCAKCHNPSNWKDVNFDHGTFTGFQLVGNHKGAPCTSCHVNGVYKGTPANCFACHADKDKHNGQFGKDCGSCHNPKAWKDVNFDHSKTGFPLAGSHAGVPCTSCHVNGVYKGTSRDCYSCHANKDKHNGQFGTVCSACHKPTKWSDVNFDHNNTGFPLSGSHTNAQCSACHINGVYKGTPADCYSCHANKDKHNGQFGANCGSCHKPTKWSDVNFNHNNTSFPLSGGHTNIQCGACHVNGVYKGTPTNCYSCHANKDKHNGQFGTNCGSCHNPSGWANATFNHNNTGFPLAGKHANVGCTNCHQNGVYQGTPSQCAACHQDAHNGENGADCAACHTPKGWGN